jgi:putative thioredoxin
MIQTPGNDFPLRGAVDLSGLGRPSVPEPGVPGGAPAAGGYVVDVTEQTFQALVESSAQYPVLVLLWIPTDQACAQLGADLATLAAEKDGRFQLARVDVEQHPAVAGAFQAQGVPTVVAVLAGQPVPLFQGGADLEQIRPVVEQVLAAAEQNGVTGRAPRAEGAELDGTPEPVAPPLPPHHQEAYDAIEAGDLHAAAEAYRAALRSDPRDDLASAVLAQVSLLERTQGADLAAVRTAAAEGPEDVDAQLAVADLDMVGGKVEDALDRLIDLIPATSGDEREQVRLRLVDYLAVLGPQDPRVAPARRRMTSALY